MPVEEATEKSRRQSYSPLTENKSWQHFAEKQYNTKECSLYQCVEAKLWMCKRQDSFEGLNRVPRKDDKCPRKGAALLEPGKNSDIYIGCEGSGTLVYYLSGHVVKNQDGITEYGRFDYYEFCLKLVLRILITVCNICKSVFCPKLAWCMHCFMGNCIFILEKLVFYQAELLLAGYEK